MRIQRSPGIKLLFVGLVGFVLLVPLLMVYALVSDRQHQARTAQDSITQGWGGPQMLSGPVLVVPYDEVTTQTENRGGQVVTREVTSRREVVIAPSLHRVSTDLEPEVRRKSIYETVTYLAATNGAARFVLPDDLDRLDVERSSLRLAESELRFGVSDPRGLQGDASAEVGGETVALKPGRGPMESGGSGFHGYVEWDGEGPLVLDYNFTLRGSRALSLVPNGGQTEWSVESTWAHPSFAGGFLPDTRSIGDDGFKANWSVANLALGRSLASTSDTGIVVNAGSVPMPPPPPAPKMRGYGEASFPAQNAEVRLVEPVDLYSQVDRSVKYGFLVIGFTFLTFLMFDLVAGARVAAAEYLLTGAGLVLFFVLLLAFAEVIGFAAAFAGATIAIVGLLTAYSAAVLGTRKRAFTVGAILLGLYAALYVLLSLEAYSLLVGSVLLFFALAGVMYATRGIDWSSVGGRKDSEPMLEEEG
ncbi:cell envelope integrity protein CreD [Altererythrobacter sp. MTPC7]|uniref:cell envelope integrity protein CreD n=1 Tax=Altererythrobacter sp. MTPC7 TaxID=3056567 RepID=UPI0036F42B5E